MKIKVYVASYMHAARDLQEVSVQIMTSNVK